MTDRTRSRESLGSRLGLIQAFASVPSWPKVDTIRPIEKPGDQEQSGHFVTIASARAGRATRPHI